MEIMFHLNFYLPHWFLIGAMGTAYYLIGFNLLLVLANWPNADFNTCMTLDSYCT